MRWYVMEELHGVYVSTVEAAAMMSKHEAFITHLCSHGKLAGVRKFGKSWLIPIDSVKSYTPSKRGAKPRKEKLAGELAGIRAEIAASKEEQPQ
jgi:hypothetical protein